MPLLKQKNQSGEIALLGVFPLFPDVQAGTGIAFGNNQKTKGFATIPAVTAVMNIMGIDHPVEVSRTPGRPPPDALMHNKIMEKQVKKPVQQYSECNGKYPGITEMYSIHKQRNGGQTENHTEEIIFFKGMVVPCVMGFMPAPEEAVHHILVSPVSHKLPEEKSGNGNESAKEIKHS